MVSRESGNMLYRDYMGIVLPPYSPLTTSGFRVSCVCGFGPG